MYNGKLVILAGGISSRMRKPLTESKGRASSEGILPVINERLIKDADEKSKSMIGVGRNFRPFLNYLLFKHAKRAIVKSYL